MTEIIRRKPAIDSRIERSILTGMITSERFITEIQSFYRPNILRSDFANIVAEWCQEYYQKYKKPPASAIEDIFRTHRETQLDPAHAELIEEFLSSISQEYETGEKFNTPYILDQTEKHFRLSALENQRFELSKCIAGGRIDDGEALIANFKRVTRQEIKGVDPFDQDSIINALDENSGDTLFKLHGALGQAVGTLERGHLFAVVGASGIGKTWWLLYIALRALFSGYKVLFVSLEMSERQIIQRILHWLTGLPKAKYAGQILIPVFDCIKNQTGECSDGCKVSLIKEGDKEKTYYDRTDFIHAPIGYKPCTKCMGSNDFQPTSWYQPVEREALEISSALRKKKAIERLSAVRNKRLKIAQFPSGELTMQGFETYLDNLEYYEGFVSDVIITDYADKFKRSEREYRHGINEIWEGHKAIAQKRHCLMATGSQSSAARSGRDTKRGDWAEDIRKLNLIDIGFAINQNDWEHDNNIYRCGVAKQRHDEFSLVGQVMILNQLRIGRPYINSYQMLG